MKKVAQRTKKTPDSAKPRDLFTALKKDHRTVADLFKRFEKASSASVRADLYAKIRTELTNHANAEEAAMYPRLKEKKVTKDITLESLEEHDVVKHLMHKLDRMSEKDERFEAAVTVLKEVVEHHVEEEESTMFSKIRRAFTKTERDQMLEAFEASKEGFFAPLKRLVA